MSKKKMELLRVHNFENNIPYNKPELPPKLYERTLTSITNALDAEAYLDEKGQLWIAREKLHQILRTSKHNANEMFDSFENTKKIGRYWYVRGHEVIGRISKEIEESDTLKKGHYLRFSEKCLTSIRDSDRAIVKRAEYNEEWRENKKKLKARRINTYGILNDELTGAKLIVKTAEFSHIRSSSNYKELSLDIENGLIVNKSTHELITASGVNNEEELKFLCDQKGWSLDWYDEYKKYLRSRME